MTLNELLPLAVLASSLLPGLIIFALPEERIRLRTALNLFGALAKLVLIGILLAGVAAGEEYGFRYAVLPGIDRVHQVLKGKGDNAVTKIVFEKPVRGRAIKIVQTGRAEGLFWSIHELTIESQPVGK